MVVVGGCPLGAPLLAGYPAPTGSKTQNTASAGLGHTQAGMGEVGRGGLGATGWGGGCLVSSWSVSFGKDPQEPQKCIESRQTAIGSELGIRCPVPSHFSLGAQRG